MTKQDSQNSYKNLFNIFEDVVTQPVDGMNDSLQQALAKLRNKLVVTQVPSAHEAAADPMADTLEKVSYHMDMALQTFEKISGAAVNTRRQVNFTFALSETYETLGNYERALSNYEKVLEISLQSKDLNMLGLIQYRMACILSEMGKWSEADELLRDAIQSLQSVGNEREVAQAQIERAKIAFRRSQYSHAETLFNEALETAERINDIRARAAIGNHLGVIRRMEENYELAYLHFQEALIELKSVQDFRGTADCLNNLGLLHLLKQERPKAIDCFDRALEMCHEIGHFPLLPFVYLNKTEYYCDIQDFPMAANTCSSALENLIRLRNPIGVAKTNMLFGRIFWKSGDFVTSRKFYQESIRLYRTFEIPLGLANCYSEFADMLEQSGNQAEALDFHAKGNEIIRSLREPAGAADERSHEVVTI